MGTIHEKIAYTEETKELLKTALNENGANVTDSDTFRSYVEQVPKVYEAGYKEGTKSEYDKFWDIFQDYGNRTEYECGFTGIGWNDENCKIKYKKIKNNNMYMFFRSNRSLNALVDVEIDTSDCKSFSYAFMYSFVKYIPFLDMSKCTSCSMVFHSCNYLQTLSIKSSKTTPFDNTVFQYAPKIENFNVTGTIGVNGFNVQWSPLLTRESLLSILNALEDKSADTSGTTWIVTIGSENIAKLDEETELSIAWQKGWEVY